MSNMIETLFSAIKNNRLDKLDDLYNGLAIECGIVPNVSGKIEEDVRQKIAGKWGYGDWSYKQQEQLQGGSGAQDAYEKSCNITEPTDTYDGKTTYYSAQGAGKLEIEYSIRRFPQTAFFHSAAIKYSAINGVDLNYEDKTPLKKANTRDNDCGSYDTLPDGRIGVDDVIYMGGLLIKLGYVSSDALNGPYDVDEVTVAGHQYISFIHDVSFDSAYSKMVSLGIVLSRNQSGELEAPDELYSCDSEVFKNDASCQNKKLKKELNKELKKKEQLAEGVATALNDLESAYSQLLHEAGRHVRE